MNICVIATASRESGALSIYLQFLNALKGQGGNARYYIFVDECMPQPQIEGVTYIIYDTRGFKRITFDFIGFKKTIKKLHITPDRIVSFQNTAVYYPGVQQMIYFHNLLPLSKKRWNPFASKERTLFFYTSLYPYYIRCLLRRDMDIAVQADFIKDMFADKYGHPIEKIHVFRPNTIIEPKQENESVKFPIEYENKYNFIYPAISMPYKRHELLVDCLKTIKDIAPDTFADIRIHLTIDKECLKGVRDIAPDVFGNIRIHLTFKSEEAPSLYQSIMDNGMEQQFVFHGKMPYQELCSYYQHSHALLFPSEMETVGLPLLEAASYGLPIAVTDMPYSNEAMGSYEGVFFMQQLGDWTIFITQTCKDTKRFKPLVSGRDNNSWLRFLQLISYGSKL